MRVLDLKAGRIHLRRVSGRFKVEDADETIHSPREAFQLSRSDRIHEKQHGR